MKNVMGIYDDRYRPPGLGDLIKHRSPGSVPFGSKYRMVDLVLSSMSFSGIKNVGIFTGEYSGSIINHVKAGKEWGLLRSKDGLFMLTSPYEENLDYLDRSTEEYVLYSRSHIVYFTDYTPIKHFLHEEEADIVLAYTHHFQPPLEKGLYFAMEEGKVTALSMKKQGDHFLRSMEMLMMKKEIFRELLGECGTSGEDPLEVLVNRQRNYKIVPYLYKGYVAYVDSIAAYFEENMSLLEERLWEDLFQGPGSIITIRNDEAPTKYLAPSDVKNTLVTEGCILKGEIENSMLFRGVKVKSGAKIRNCIIMQKAEIGRNVILEYCILDKDVKVESGVKIIGTAENPVLIGKKTVVEAD